MSAKRNRLILAALGSAALMTLMAMPAEAAKPPTAGGGGALKVEDCTACHNDTTLIVGKEYQWATSAHAKGEAFLRGTSANCAGCHSGGGFVDRILAGLTPGEVEEGDPNPTPQTCRTCHQIHVTYTGADWALETTTAVDLYEIPGATFDKGEGNLCAQCHQPRRDAPAVADLDEIVTNISTHWGPHHGPQSAMMLGVAGALPPGYVPGDTRARHYTTTEAPLADSCVSCHMGPDANHSYQPIRAVCAQCHTGFDVGSDDPSYVEGFDYRGVQSLTEERLAVIGDELVAQGVLSADPDNPGHAYEGSHPAVTEAPAWLALPLYNWLYVAHEDKSRGVHNPRYTATLLTQSCAMLKIQTCP